MMKCHRITPVDASKRDWTGWIIELKIDGTRTFYKDSHLYSDRQIVKDQHFSHIFNKLNGLDVCLDGEMSVSENSTVFDITSKTGWGDATYYIFDVIEFNAGKLYKMPLSERREILETLVKSLGYSNIQAVKSFSSFKEGWDYVINNNCEGLVFKRASSIYVETPTFFDVHRSRDWLKCKKLEETVLKIIGHEPGSVKGAFILEGNNRASALSSKVVEQYLDLSKTGKEIYAEIEYAKKTGNGILFQPVLKRFVVDGKTIDLILSDNS